MPEMTPRERWLALFAGQQADRVPVDFWSTGEVLTRLKKELQCPTDEALWRKLHIDRPRFLSPKWKLPHHPDDPQGNLWGVRHSTIEYGTGSYGEAVHHPLAKMETVAEVEAYRWPSPDDFDYTPVRAGVAQDDGYRLLKGGDYEPFLLYCAMRGMEQAFEDLLLNPEIAHAILRHLFEFYYEQNTRILEAGQGKIGLFYLAEDLAGQTGPLFSVDLYRRFLRPNQKKMADLAKSYGAHVFYHTDGAARDFIPDLLDVVGIELLNPLQWRCPGMEREGLVRDFDKRVVFHGGIDNQQTLPFGTRADLVQEVRECVGLFKGARWICAPCHNIQPVTPTENILAMYETIWEVGGR